MKCLDNEIVQTSDKIVQTLYVYHIYLPIKDRTIIINVHSPAAASEPVQLLAHQDSLTIGITDERRFDGPFLMQETTDL